MSEYFDNESKNWDQQNHRLIRAQTIADKILGKSFRCS